MLDYLTQNVWLIWILISVICLIIELGSGDLFVLCFAIGGLGASLTAAVGLGLVPQLISMALCSLLSIYFVSPVALRYLDAILGKIGQVTQTIEKGGFGRVIAGGNDWKATSADGQRIEVGTKVRVVARESIVITVEPVVSSTNN